MRAPVLSTILGQRSYIVGMRQRKRSSHILNAFFQISQIRFQRYECPLELMREGGANGKHGSDTSPMTTVLDEPHCAPTQVPRYPPGRYSGYVEMMREAVPRPVGSSVSQTGLRGMDRLT